MRVGWIAAILGLVFLAGACEEEPESIGTAPTLDTHEAPDTPEELVERMVDAVAATGDVLHVRADLVYPGEGGEDELYGELEGWFDFDELTARVSYQKGADNTTDTAEWQEYWFGEDGLFRQGPDDDAPRPGIVGELWHSCIGLEPLVADVLVCGMASQPANYELTEPATIVEGTWNGVAAVGIQYVWEREFQSQPRPGQPPTPTPGMGTPTAVPEESFVSRLETEFFVDTATYFPLGIRGRTLRDGVEAGSGEIRYETALIDRDDFDTDLLDPRAAGFRTEEEAEMELLDNPEGGGPVYWLGREFDAGPDIGTLVLAAAEDWYHPERPTAITLRYANAAGDVLSVDVWEEVEWRAFMGRLQESDNNSGRWPYGEACRVVTPFDANGSEGNIIGGHYSEMRPGGGVVVVTPGVEPPTATPFPPQPCPEGEPDEFMAEVFIDGYAVTFNASVGIFSDGEPDTFDSPEVLMALAQGLQLREDGE